MSAESDASGTRTPPANYEETRLGMYRELLKRDAGLASEQDAYGRTPIHHMAATPTAFSQRFLQSYLDLLTSHGAQVDHRDLAGKTPLELAAVCLSEQQKGKAAQDAIERQTEVIRMLLRKGACVDLLPKATPQQRHVRGLVKKIDEEVKQAD
ncbi:unnamed protein product [Vitrella brassicaformis CCMP3155]|uniref:Uncharacterized protein n=2 Tax=Vitrella brassicaformis TaxID=1169539 RepID=A0A0G4EIE4_VITBC|nr:unnamed protein product [Vitrella brassicaformis CCMP3155]|mmetsp:Transcript_16125/g.38537  ORF Transcript_16125/g.38537 Transcript_16125/m.38537 type:complete len:153 (+) Transcript_16125:69-527(+)|eukprot:CEL96043.1 unnamed protein product [Vitrella brassicaformis CCMP3155]